MKTIRIDHKQIPKLQESVCAIGYFDGLHIGHQELIEQAKADAKKLHVQSAVATFDPDPWKIIHPDANLEHLSDLDDKATILSHAQIDVFYILDFTADFANLSVDSFHQVIEDLNIRELVCGFDYHYGAKGAGNVETLQRASGFETKVIGQVSKANDKISSSRIEKLIRQGDVKEANELLGYIYSIKGIVVHGYQRGRILGFPTANLSVGPESILPKNGVYAGYVQMREDLYPAMINVGYNPTFNNQEKTIEANILNFNEDIYDVPTRFYFVEQLRNEKKFNSLDELKVQLTNDQKSVLPCLNQQKSLYSRTTKLWSLRS